MKKYSSFFRIRFSATLQYRTAAVAGMLTQLAFGLMYILALRAFYIENPQNFPMSMQQTASYIWLQQAFLALFMTWFFEGEIFEAIMKGHVAYDLVRPMDLYSRWFTQNIANRLAKAALRCLPIFAVAFLLPADIRLNLPPNIFQFLLFIISAALALCLVVALSMFVYISTFYTLNPMGVRMVFVMLTDFLSGGVLPLPFFPDNIRKIIELSPFGSMQNMPLRIYSGNIYYMDAFKGIALQIFWLAVLLITGRMFMKKALHKLVVQGG